jgi:SAM-dependent methyltransferase
MIDRRRLFEAYWSVRSVIAPSLRYSQFLYEDVLNANVTSDSTWLDLGCGHQLLPTWRRDEEAQLIGRSRLVVGLDYDFQSLRHHTTVSRRVRGDITRLPFAERSFELVTANMVVEHLDNPEEQFREVHRILKPGGKFIFHTPNAYGHFAALRKLTPSKLKDVLVPLLDGRAPEDVFPVRYRANTRSQITRIAGSVGFDVLKTKMIVSDAITAVVLPLAAIELLWIRLLMTAPLRPLRTNIIAILQKPPEL